MADVPETTEIAIVGAGAAGAFLAHRLASAGRQVTVLDAGPAWETSDLISSQIWARRLKWGGVAVENAGALPFGHNMNMGWGLGGAALHHYASWPRLHPTDFETQSAFGRGLDWPIGYDDLRPHYDRIQAEFGISGDADAEVTRPPGAPYPHPPLEAFAGGKAVARGFEAIGLPVFPAPMAVLSERRGGRAACIYDGWCDAGCPIGALANPLVTSVPDARAAGATFHALADVRSVEAKDGKARALLWADEGGRTRRLRADTFVLAAGAIHNVRLLFASAGRDGAALGNGQDLLGRYFGSHLIANAHGLFEEETEPHMGLSAGTLMTQDRQPGGAVTWGLGPAVKPNDLIGLASTRPELFGPPLDAFMRRASRHVAVANGICENVGLRDSRLVPTGKRDARGRDVIRIEYAPSPVTMALWERANEQGLAAIEAAGATEAWTSDRPIVSHALGGTAMGEDPAASVTDTFGRLHEAPNVVVAGSGLFPSGGAVSPTFTLLALADRTAVRMAEAPEEFA